MVLSRELTLALLVTWLDADYTNRTTTTNDLTVTTDLLNRCTNFHLLLRSPQLGSPPATITFQVGFLKQGLILVLMRHQV